VYFYDDHDDDILDDHTFATSWALIGLKRAPLISMKAENGECIRTSTRAVSLELYIDFGQSFILALCAKRVWLEPGDELTKGKGVAR
jgi:hypothetical protein